MPGTVPSGVPSGVPSAGPDTMPSTTPRGGRGTLCALEKVEAHLCAERARMDAICLRYERRIVRLEGDRDFLLAAQEEARASAEGRVSAATAALREAKGALECAERRGAALEEALEESSQGNKALDRRVRDLEARLKGHAEEAARATAVAALQLAERAARIAALEGSLAAALEDGAVRQPMERHAEAATIKEGQAVRALQAQVRRLTYENGLLAECAARYGVMEERLRTCQLQMASHRAIEERLFRAEQALAAREDGAAGGHVAAAAEGRPLQGVAEQLARLLAAQSASEDATERSGRLASLEAQLAALEEGAVALRGERDGALVALSEARGHLRILEEGRSVYEARLASLTGQVVWPDRPRWALLTPILLLCT